MEKITYQELSNLLIAVGLSIEKLEDNKYKIVGSNREFVYTKRGSVYGAIAYQSESLDDFTQKAFKDMTENGDILIGTQTSFSKRVIYSNNGFKIIPLSEEEMTSFNSDY